MSHRGFVYRVLCVTLIKLKTTIGFVGNLEIWPLWGALRVLEASWRRLGGVLEASWSVLEASWSVLEASCRRLGSSWSLLEAS